MSLTHKQKRVLEKVSADWTDLPPGIGCTNSTLTALEKRRLVETRIKPGEYHRFFSGWQWRLTPKESA
jgi:hypothetical protein